MGICEQCCSRSQQLKKAYMAKMFCLIDLFYYIIAHKSPLPPPFSSTTTHDNESPLYRIKVWWRSLRLLSTSQRSQGLYVLVAICYVHSSIWYLVTSRLFTYIQSIPSHFTNRRELYIKNTIWHKNVSSRLAKRLKGKKTAKRNICINQSIYSAI